MKEEEKRRMDAEKKRAAYWADPGAARAKMAEQYRKHRATRLQAMREWRLRNLEKERARGRQKQKDNPALVRSIRARRRAAELRATPSWANRFFIEEIYHLAVLRTQFLGVPHHVDHIVPLQSPKVCGLHVEHNLRVLAASVNRAKSNRWPEQEEQRHDANCS